MKKVVSLLLICWLVLLLCVGCVKTKPEEKQPTPTPYVEIDEVEPTDEVEEPLETPDESNEEVVDGDEGAENVEG